jgi:hypothetical protein
MEEIMSDTFTAPGIGHNEQGPDYAAQEVVRLAREYPELDAVEEEIGADAKALPRPVESDEDMSAYIAIIKRAKEHRANLVAWHAKEKLPWYQRGIGTDNFFFRRIERFGRRNKNDKPGLVDILSAHVHDWQERKRLAEEARRRAEAEEAARKLREAQEAEAKRLREAEEARLAAERARKPEHIERKDQIAAQLEAAAQAATVEATMAADKALEATTATGASAAQMVRTRVDEGMATMGTTKTAAIVDFAALKSSPVALTALAPFLKHEWLEQAVRQWARTTNYSEELPGVSVGTQRKTIIR